jgi:filamentous hemagglutinin family protein
MTRTQQINSWLTCVVVGFGTIALSTAPAIAQIIPDETLGDERSVVTPNVTVRSGVGDRIDGGATRGVNLFHSFRELNVAEGQRVYFANPTGIETILSRVTGNDVSDILGTLGVDGGANLFLLNPNGIMFGPNAQLDVSGSFLASTATRFTFPDGSEFSASNPQVPPLLTVNVPIGLQFGTNSSGTITNTGSLTAAQDLTLSATMLDVQGQLQAGRNLTLQAQDTLQIRDSATTPFIAAAGGEMLLQGNQTVDIFALNHPNSGLFSDGDMVLRSPNPVRGDVHYWSGGNFRVETLDANLGTLYSPHDPIIQSLGDVNILIYQGASLHILAGGRVDIGTVIVTNPDTSNNTINPITTPALANVVLSTGDVIVIDGSAQPTLDVRAGVDPTVIGSPLGVNGNNFRFLIPSQVNTSVATGSDITIGDVFFVGLPNSTVFLTNQFQPNSVLPDGNITVTGAGLFGFGIVNFSSEGNSGSVVLDSRNTINLTRSNTTSTPNLIDASSTSGVGGDITLIANGNIASDSDILTNGVLGGNLSLISNSDILLTNALVSTSGEGSGIIRIQGNQVTLNNAAIQANTVDTNGREILVEARNLTLQGRANISASTEGQGTAGNLTIQTTDSVSLLNGGLLTTTSNGAGDGGFLSIETRRLGIQGGSVVVDAFNSGNAGNLSIKASELVEMANGRLSASTNAANASHAGNITIEARQLNIQNSEVGTQTARGSLGNAGNLTIRTTDSVNVFNNSLVNASSRGTGTGGNLLIETERLRVQDGAIVGAGATGSGGRAGRITVNASSSVDVIGRAPDGVIASALFSGTSDAGTGGDLTINTNQLAVHNGAVISTSTLGEGQGGDLVINANRLIVQDGGQLSAGTAIGAGQGGDLTVNASELIELTGETSVNGRTLVSGLFSTSQGFGEAGDLTINTARLVVRNGAAISAGTDGGGQAGDLNVNASRSVELVGTSTDARFFSTLSTRTLGDAPAGNLRISAGQLSIRGGAGITAETLGGGQAGNVTIDVSGRTELIGESVDGGFASSVSTRSQGDGNGGTIRISTGQLTVQDEAQISASTSAAGRAGNISIQGIDSVSLSNGIISTAVAAGASGRGGNVALQTRLLSLTNRAQIRASTQGQGDAGNVTVTANTVNATQGSQILSSTTSSSDAGNITLRVQDDVRLDGDRTGLFANTAPNSTGNGGSIFIDPQTVVLRDGARIAVDSQGRGEGGNIRIRAGALTLANNALISAETASNTGGDIALQVDDLLLLRDRSTISTTAGNDRAGGDGGNISIGANFIVAVPAENSDITANAFEGRGGNIAITTEGIYGIEFREQLTPFSDITATSTFGINGEVVITTPGIDPSRGLAELPTDVTDASQQIARACSTSETAANDLGEFVITGRGGLPPNPANLLSDETVLSQFVTPNRDGERAESREEVNSAFNTLSTSESSVVEAQGWITDARGQVTLIAEAFNAASNLLSITAGRCGE